MNSYNFAVGAMVALSVLATACAEGSATGDAADSAQPRLAVQLYTLRNVGAIETQLALASRAGYEAVESLGAHGLAAEEFRELLDRYGLEVVSSHESLDTLRSGLGRVIQFHHAIGNDRIVMPYLPAADRPDGAAGWRTLGRELDAIGARLREAGIGFVYHNHDFELIRVDGRLALEHVLEAADPSNLHWQADVAWIDRAGFDPADMLERHADRVISIHAKDNAPPGENAAEGGFADVGYGRLAWDEILDAALEADVDLWIVEHDEPADPERTVRRARQFLESWLERRD